MGGNTNTPIVIGILTFYLFVFVLLGLVGGQYQASQVITPPTTPGLLSFLVDAIAFFVNGIAFSVTNLGFFNVIFVPGAFGLFYILLSYLRGSS